MTKAYEERLEKYRQLKEEHPDWAKKDYAEAMGVHPSAIGRWDEKLAERSIEERVIAKIEAKYEAKLQAVLEEQEREREERERQKREAEERASENRHAHFRRILEECPKETITTKGDEDIIWQGFRFHIPGGVPTEVPEVIAGVLRDAQNARRARDQLISGLTARAKDLGTMGRIK